MIEQTQHAIDQARELAEKVRTTAREGNISIPAAAKKAGVPIYKYYAALSQIKKTTGHSEPRLNKRATIRAATVSPPIHADNGRGVNVRELREQIETLNKENAQLREELLDVLIENRHMRAKLDRE